MGGIIYQADTSASSTIDVDERDCSCGSYGDPDSYTVSISSYESGLVRAAEQVEVCFSDMVAKQKALRRAQEALFLAECKRGWVNLLRNTTAQATSTHRSRMPIAYQRRFRRHNRREGVRG